MVTLDTCGDVDARTVPPSAAGSLRRVAAAGGSYGLRVGGCVCAATGSAPGPESTLQTGDSMKRNCSSALRLAMAAAVHTTAAGSARGGRAPSSCAHAMHIVNGRRARSHPTPERTSGSSRRRGVIANDMSAAEAPGASQSRPPCPAAAARALSKAVDSDEQHDTAGPAEKSALYGLRGRTTLGVCTTHLRHAPSASPAPAHLF